MVPVGDKLHIASREFIVHRNMTTSDDPSVEDTGMRLGLDDLTRAGDIANNALLLKNMAEGLALHEIILDDDGVPCDYRVLAVNPAFEEMTGLNAADIIGHSVLEILPTLERSWIERYGRVALTGIADRFEDFAPTMGKHFGVVAYSPSPGQFATLVSDITERKQLESAVKRRLLALTRPPASTESIDFADLFDIEEIQSVQDAFAQATGVASIITYPDGTPITKPSNFCRLCSEVIRGTEKGLANCMQSDAVIGNSDPSGPVVHPCLSGGLWDAGTSITVGGQHVANWLIGQVRNELQDDDEMLAYAASIGADPEVFRSALAEVPTMSLDQFERIAKSLFHIANQLSVVAYQNVQQARLIAEREETDSALRDSERWLNESQRVAGLGHYVYDVVNDHWDGSQPLYELFGIDDTYERDEAGWIGIVHPDDREKVSGYFSRGVLANQAPFDLEYRIVRPRDGVQRYVHGLGKVEFEENGHPVTMFGVIQDITEHVNVQQALRDSIDTFRFVFEFSVVAQSITLPTGEIQGNEAFYDMLGYAQEEVDASTTFSQFTHPDDVEMSEGHAADLLSGKEESARFEKRYLHKNGSIVWADVSTSLRRDASGNALYFMTTMLDITERKRAETALQETTAILQAALDQSPAGIAIADAPHGTLRYLNDAGLLLLGGDRQTAFEGVGIDLYVPRWRLVDVDGLPLGAEDVPLACAILYGDTSFREFIVQHDGDDRIVIGRAAPIRDGAGQVVAGIMVFSDITEDKLTEAELERLLEERERNMEQLSSSLSSIIALVGQVVETRDPYTAGHERRVAELAVGISETLQLPAEQIEEIRLAALIHDVGKMSVPAEILSKPGRLSTIEFELIKGHSESGYRILCSANMSEDITQMVYQHHERCDGSGYPRGLKATELLPGAKVIMVADVVEAMVSHRPYRAGLGAAAALDEIERGAGTQYDPDVVEACLKLFRENHFEFTPHTSM